MRNHAFFLSALSHGKSSILAPDSSLEPSFLTDKSFPRSKSEGPRPFFNRGQATGGLCADLGAVTLRRLSCRGQNAKEVRWKRDQNMKDPGLYYVQGRESSWLNFYEGEVHGLFSQAKSPDFFLCLTGLTENWIHWLIILFPPESQIHLFLGVVPPKQST